jgi:hypothetical protein
MKAVFNELRWIEAISGELVVIEYNLSSVGVKQAASFARDMHVFQLIQVPWVGLECVFSTIFEIRSLGKRLGLLTLLSGVRRIIWTARPPEARLARRLQR